MTVSLEDSRSGVAIGPRGVDSHRGRWSGKRAPLRACFVALQAYNVLSQDRTAPHIGGAEVQQCIIARGLLERGYDVSFVTLDHGQEDGECLRGIRIYRSYAPTSGVRGIRFFHPRITSAWRAMRRADADVYFQRTSDPVTGVVAAFCQRHGRRFVFSLGAMADCDPALPNCRTRRERWLYLYGLRRAHARIAQTGTQQECLRRHFGVTSTIVRSTAIDPSNGPSTEPEKNGSPKFLWVGRDCREKRPHLLVQLARRCPAVEFDAVGLTEEQFCHLLPQIDIRTVPNLHLHGYVPHHEVHRYYSGVWALISTSITEGFPNTFLEAWSRGIPVLTTFDPDGVVAAAGLGRVAADVCGLAGYVEQLASCKYEWMACSVRCRQYYLANHAPDVILQKYESMLEGIGVP